MIRRIIRNLHPRRILPAIQRCILHFRRNLGCMKALRPSPNTEAIPVYIVSHDNYTYVRNFLAQLRRLDVAPGDIYVVDNASTYPPLLDLLSELEIQGYHVYRLSENFGPYVLKEPRAGLNLPSHYILSDPDLQFHPDFPASFRQDLKEITEICGTWKGGSALDISDSGRFLPGNYSSGKSIPEWESKYWIKKVRIFKNRLNHLSSSLAAATVREGDVYWAAIDTTLSLCIAESENTGLGYLDAVRVAGAYRVFHLPWYRESFETLSGNGLPTPIKLFGEINLVRPTPLELDQYKRTSAQGVSTVLTVVPDSTPDRDLIITSHEDGYKFLIANSSPHATWWKEHFEKEWKARTFQLLRKFLSSPRGPMGFLDLGSWIGSTALWAAHRCEHVYCVEADPQAVLELSDNIRVNRLEHRVTLLPLAADFQLKFLNFSAIAEHYEMISDRANLFINCDLRGEEEDIISDLFKFAMSKEERITAILISFQYDDWKDQEGLEIIFKNLYENSPELCHWQVFSERLEVLKGPLAITEHIRQYPLHSLIWANPRDGSNITTTSTGKK